MVVLGNTGGDYRLPSAHRSPVNLAFTTGIMLITRGRRGALLCMRQALSWHRLQKQFSQSWVR